VSQRTFNKWFFKAPFLLPHRTFSNQGSLRNHVLKEFIKEPIKVPQRTLKKWFHVLKEFLNINKEIKTRKNKDISKLYFCSEVTPNF